MCEPRNAAPGEDTTSKSRLPREGPPDRWHFPRSYLDANATDRVRHTMLAAGPSRCRRQERLSRCAWARVDRKLTGEGSRSTTALRWRVRQRSTVLAPVPRGGAQAIDDAAAGTVQNTHQPPLDDGHAAARDAFPGLRRRRVIGDATQHGRPGASQRLCAHLRREGYSADYNNRTRLRGAPARNPAAEPPNPGRDQPQALLDEARWRSTKTARRGRRRHAIDGRDDAGDRPAHRKMNVAAPCGGWCLCYRAAEGRGL